MHSLAFQPLDCRREECVLELVHLAPFLIFDRTHVAVNVALSRVKLTFGVFRLRLQITYRTESRGNLLERRTCPERIAFRFPAQLGRRLGLHEQSTVFVTQAANWRWKLLLRKAIKWLFQMSQKTLLNACELELENAKILIICMCLFLARLFLL